MRNARREYASYLRHRAESKAKSRALRANDMARDVKAAEQEPLLPCLYTWDDVRSERREATVWVSVAARLARMGDSAMTFEGFRTLVALVRADVYAKWNGPTGKAVGA